ncbi:glutaredoxin [Caulobacter phage Cr30]|uniref:glutaredoxin n=1 Tax=Caulobacter phage Cr30 TaxID=1357714 RepID=UPI0004A9B5A8|nr:glutaredoxin [Caulobacter phage Cr30]AGS80896.1 glutaredoxin [Caulobacter phage Cr30]
MNSTTIIYGRTEPRCTYCEQAKTLLEIKGIDYTFLNLGTDYTKEELLELVPEAKTVPQIFIEGKHIGGFDKLKEQLDAK